MTRHEQLLLLALEDSDRLLKLAVRVLKMNDDQRDGSWVTLNKAAVDGA